MGYAQRLKLFTENNKLNLLETDLFSAFQKGEPFFGHPEQSEGSLVWQVKNVIQVATILLLDFSTFLIVMKREIYPRYF